MAKLIVNRWGLLIAVGERVIAYGGHSGVVMNIDITSRFARAYGPQLTLDSGVGVCADDARTFRACLQSQSMASDCHDLTIMTALLHTSRDFTARAEQMARLGL